MTNLNRFVICSDYFLTKQIPDLQITKVHFALLLFGSKILTNMHFCSVHFGYLLTKLLFSQQITNMHFCSVYFVIGFSTNNKFAFCSCAFCYIFSTKCPICYLFRCKSQQITNLHFVRWNNRFEICYFRSLQITDLDFVRIFLTNLELCNKLSFCRKQLCFFVYLLFGAFTQQP